MHRVSLGQLHIFCLFILFLALGIAGKFYEKSKLSELSHQEVIERIVTKERLAFRLAPYFNQNGLELSTADRKLLNEGKLHRKYFENKRGQTKQVRCFPLTLQDTVNEIILTKLLSINPFEELSIVPLYCSDNNMQLLSKRLSGSEDTLTSRLSVLSNEQLLVSIIEQCQFPFIKEKLETSYEVIYHSSILGLREYYYHEFKKAYREGLLDEDKFLSLRSRIINKRNRYANGNKSFDIDLNKFENFAKAKEFFEQFNLDAEEVDRIAASQLKQEDNP